MDGPYLFLGLCLVGAGAGLGHGVAKFFMARATARLVNDMKFRNAMIIACIMKAAHHLHDKDMPILEYVRKLNDLTSKEGLVLTHIPLETINGLSKNGSQG